MRTKKLRCQQWQLNFLTLTMGSVKTLGLGLSSAPTSQILFESVEAKDSVAIRGPSVGTPRCGGIGPLVYRCSVGGKQYGVIHPNGILAGGEVKFRVASERICKARGLRVVSGKFHEPDFMECVRSNLQVKMKTIDNILIMETEGKASEVVDSPQFRSVVEEIKNEKKISAGRPHAIPPKVWRF